MVRKCIVPSCKSDDKKILCHRFPTKEDLVYKWMSELDLDTTKFTKADIKKYVVCTLHFDKTDYKNEITNGLNTTALPKLQGHEPRVQTITEQNVSVSKNEIAVIRNKSEEQQENVNNLNCPFEQLDWNNDIPFGLEEFSELENTMVEKHTGTTMDTSIIQCPESELSRMDDEFGGNYCITTTDIISNEDVLEEQNSEIQLYDSDVEVIEFNEAFEYEVPNNGTDTSKIQVQLTKYELCDRGNLSETVSLISSIAEAEDFEQEVEKTFANAACQTDPIEIISKEFLHALEGEEFRNKTRKDLMDLITDQKKKIIELDKKLKEFQATHVKLVQSMDAFKILLTKEIDKNS